MKNLNLIEWLFMDSHEKQKPQRLRRYAVMLMMLLTLGVGQMWGAYQGTYMGFWKDGGVELTWSKNGSSATTTLNYNAIGSGGSLGTITTGLTMTKSVVKFWRSDDHRANVCGGYVYWILYKGDTKIDEGSRDQTSMGTWSGSNNTYTVTSSLDFLAKTTGPGDYTIRIYAELKGAESSDYYDDVSYKGCGTSWWYNRNTTNGYYSITFTIPSKNLTVAGAADGNTVSGNVSGITKGTAYTITATPTAGYAFNGWTKTSGGSSITIADASSATTTVTFNDYSNDATVTANFVAEETHDVTVYYKYGTTTVKTYTTESAVGVTTERTFTAPDIDGYNFYSYTFGSGLTMKSASTTTNPCRFVTKGSGTYELTVNYNIAPVKLLYGSSTPLNSPSNTAMTYDATNKRFYVDVTTNSSPYYFRFDYNTGTQEYGGAWNTYPDVLPVTANGSKVTCATEVKGWGNKSSVKFTGLNGSAIRIYFDYFNKQTWITETTYSVTVSAGSGGTTSPSSVTAGKNTTSGDATATPDDDHAFLNWTIPSGVTAASGYSATSNPIRIKATASSKSITANFQNRWIMKGSGGVLGNWDTDKEMTKSATNTYSVTLALVAGTSYSFKFYDRKASKWYGKTSTTITKTLGSLTKDITSIVEGSGSTYNMNFTPTLSGDYTFTYNSSSGTLTIGWPDINKLEIVSGSGITPGYYDFSGPSGTVYSKSFTFAKNQRYSAKIVYHSDFYTFDNTSDMTIDNHTDWRLYNNVSDKICNVYAPVAGTYTYQFNSNNSGNTTLTVVFPTAYTITFGAGDINGSNSTISVTASPTFSSGDYVLASTAVTFNKGTTKDGYEWKGWYSNSDGTGTCHSSTDANWSSAASTRTGNISVYACYNYATYTATLSTTGSTGYGSGAPANQTATYLQAMPTITPPTATNGYCFMGYWDGEEGTGTQYYNANGTSAHAWDKTSGATLYAYFKKAEITAITFDNAVVESNGTVSFAVTVSPTPVGDTKLCFTVLHSNDNPLDDQPTITYNGVTGKYSFTASATSGMYKVQAVLRTGSTCDGGTELDTEVASFQVAGLHTVTVRYKCGDDVIKAATTTTGRPLDWSDEITAPEIVGYSFTGWEAGDGVTLTDDNGVSTKTTTTEATIKIKAIYDGYLTANYTKKRVIYFYNTLNWENVYVYFYKNDSYWGPSNQGTGANTGWQFTGYPYSEGKHGQMLPVYEGSKIYYFDAEEAGVNASYTNVAFTELDQHGCDYFYNNNKVVRRGDYHATTMPLFVPLSDQPEVKKNSNAASYYCEGYWMNYPANSGYTLRIYDTWDADNVTGASREFLIPFSEDVKMPLKQDVEINFSGKSWFIIYRNDGNYLEGSHTFKQTDHGDKKITSNANASKAKKMTLISDGSGIYTFTLSFYGDGGSPENYDYYINVDFPAAVGDYRIVYKDNATWTHGAHGNNYATWYHPSDIIGKNNSATETKEDTVSFFVSYGSSPAMKFQYISAINATTGAITWTDVTSGSITIPASITEAGVYNFIVTQPAGGASISLVKAEPYTGNYYIRTDCAGETKWNNFRSHDHLMNYSEYSITHGGYSHYYTHWVQTGDKPNIQFCIANDYSAALTDTLVRENNAVSGWENINTYIDGDGKILRNANVRFMWNQSTNVISRAYVDGAQAEGTRFLVISSTDGKVTQADGSALSNNEVTFSDTENWIYEAYVQAQPKAQFKLVSTWGTGTVITQYFKGSSSTTETLIDGSGTDWYDIRLLYDFKTNRLVAAWVPSDANIVVDNPINADVMFIREHQGDIAQLTFGESGKISKITTAYGVIRFNKYTLANKEKTGSHSPLGSPASIYERSLFWISFPFRVKLSEVFGFGTYGEHWAIQRYDGTDRAARGHFLENGSFWRWMNRSTEYLEPNQGYLLAIDLDLLGESSSVWGPESRSDQIELYFPSYGTMPDITNASVSQTIPSHECTINRAATEGLPDTGDPRTSYNRTIFDSHWNVLSVPTYVNTTSVSFANTTWTAAGKRGPKFLYTWNADDNTITATTASGYTYHAMHAYMAQYAGTITWTASSGSPASIVARKTYEEQPSEVEFRLELQQNEKMIDRTFVILSNDEEVSADFQFGEDMTKEFNASKASIYTFIPNIAAVAGNTLPMSEQTTVIPVGVQIKANGDYTFSMPDGTSGIGVSLIDNETGIRTNLGLTDYTVTLTAGTYDQRFMLEIPPVSNMPTDIEEVTGDGLQVTGVRKVLIDNKLFIIKDGEVYDARGAKVK